MGTWMDIAEQEIPAYNADLEDSGMLEDIGAFWEHLSEERTKKGIKPVGSD